MIKRFRTREVMVGNLGIGGLNPVRIQSMTNTNTLDTAATVEQTIRLADAGCELVRITAQGVREAENLAVIKEELYRYGYQIPLIADIHFNPKAAEVAAGIVEKVRINPGNYTDRNRGKTSFTDQEYRDANARITEKIAPLIEICKRNNTALRIGSNHGSISERIIHRFGNTPAGMVEAALEFVRICSEMDFHQIVLSMKASNVRVMVLATRLLVKQMIEEDMDYPIHFGVTEAGDGLDGRIKSAAGSGALLTDGIGDTHRVSLTEDPVNEIPVARMIRDHFSYENALSENPFAGFFYDPFIFEKKEIQTSGFPNVLKFPMVIGGKNSPGEVQPDLVSQEDALVHPEKTFRVIDCEKANENDPLTDTFISLHPGQIKHLLPKTRNEMPGVALVAVSQTNHPVEEWRNSFRFFSESGIKNPVILKKQYKETNPEILAIKSALDFGPLFIDGFGDGIWIENEALNPGILNDISFRILQACGARITKTEYIACPSCGRTLYDIQSSLQKIKEKTSHLAGLKIGVMGCIVNGPGEMADADYGYVGMGSGKVAIFKGRQLFKKEVDEVVAIDELINLIKQHGDWREKTD